MASGDYGMKVKLKPKHVISHGTAVIMVRETFNAMDPEQIETIIGAACRGDWPKDSYWGFTREEFAARLASVQALFRHVMITRD